MLPESVLKISFNAKIQKTWQNFLFIKILLTLGTKASIGWLRQDKPTGVLVYPYMLNKKTDTRRHKTTHGIAKTTHWRWWQATLQRNSQLTQ